MTHGFHDRCGFTLIEILVALLIGAMIITAGRQLFDASVDEQQRLQSSFSLVAAQSEAIAEMQRAVRTARASASVPFRGSSDRVSFAAWCPDAYGGRARCAVQISTEPVLLLDERLTSGNRHVWTADFSGGRLDFVAEASGADGIVGAWESESSAPLAVRWISREKRTGARDTLLFELERSAP